MQLGVQNMQCKNAKYKKAKKNGKRKAKTCNLKENYMDNTELDQKNASYEMNTHYPHYTHCTHRALKLHNVHNIRRKNTFFKLKITFISAQRTLFSQMGT